MNVATLPGIVGPSLAMPDIHQGYGFPIGGVAAMDMDYGVVSPGGVGFDINCGVRLVRTNLAGRRGAPAAARAGRTRCSATCPAAPARAGFVKIERAATSTTCSSAARNGWSRTATASQRDARVRRGRRRARRTPMPRAVSARAKERGLPQLGTLGSGNHFLEVQYVEEVADDGRRRACWASRPGRSWC